jgi:hypothetical protein
MTDDTRPAWDFPMTEAQFRQVYRHGRIVTVSSKWEMTGADTSREWLEVTNSDGKIITMPPNWKQAFDFAGHSTNPGLFRLTYEGERMRDRLQAIDSWEAKNAADRAAYERLRAKFGEAP